MEMLLVWNMSLFVPAAAACPSSAQNHNLQSKMKESMSLWSHEAQSLLRVRSLPKTGHPSGAKLPQSMHCRPGRACRIHRGTQWWDRSVQRAHVEEHGPWWSHLKYCEPVEDQRHLQSINTCMHYDIACTWNMKRMQSVMLVWGMKIFFFQSLTTCSSIENEERYG